VNCSGINTSFDVMGGFHSAKKLLVKMREGIGIEGSVKCRCRQV